MTSRFTGLAPMLRHDLVRVVSVASTWVLLGTALLLAVASPLTAAHGPEILAALAGPDMADVLRAGLPDPSWQEAGAQWAKNMGQVLTFLFVVIAATTAVSTVTSGTAQFVLARGVSRRAYLLSAVAGLVAVAALTAVAGGLVAWIATLVVFPDCPAPWPLATSLVWLVELCLVVAVLVLAAVWTRRFAVTVCAGLATVLLLGLGGLWPAGARVSPLGIGPWTSAAAAGATPSVAEWWVLSTTLVATVALLAAAFARFSRCELP